MAALEPEQTALPQLVAALDRFFSKLKPGDDAVFVFEGHGLQQGGRSVLVGSNHTASNAAVLPVDNVVDIMLKNKPRNCVLILDACHSGQSQLRKLFYDPLQGQSGVSVLSACDLGERALDVKELGGGLFTFMLLRALECANGQWEDGFRKATVSSVFGFVAKQVPAWIDANRQRFKLGQDFVMTSRFIANLRGDPVLTLVLVARNEEHHRRDLQLLEARGSLNSELNGCLQKLDDTAQVCSRYALEQLGRDTLYLETETHHRELEMLLGRCLCDVGDCVDPLEAFVLMAAVRTHDLGLLGAERPLEQNRFLCSAKLIRLGEARELVIPMPDATAAEAVARIVEQMANPTSNVPHLIYWRGIEIRTALLGSMLALAHTLSVMGERHGQDVGGEAFGRL